MIRKLAVIMSVIVLGLAASPAFSQITNPAQSVLPNAVMPASQSVMANEGLNVAAQADLLTLYNAMTLLYLDTGRLPSNAEGLNALTSPSTTYKNWHGPYLTIMSWRNPLIDVWGQPFRYFNTSTAAIHGSFCIKSNGPDMLPDTADDLAIGQCGTPAAAAAAKKGAVRSTAARRTVRYK